MWKRRNIHEHYKQVGPTVFSSLQGKFRSGAYKPEKFLLDNCTSDLVLSVRPKLYFD